MSGSTPFLPSRLPGMRGAGVGHSLAKQGGGFPSVPPVLPARQSFSSSHPGRTVATNNQGTAGASLAPEANRGPFPLEDAAIERCRVLLFRGRGVISALVRWQTRSIYSHSAILLPDGRILEAWQGSGVRIRDLPSGGGIEHFKVKGITPAQWRQAIAFGRDQLGKGYDYVSVLRFVSRRNAPENGRWFCSELVAAALQVAGLPFLSRVDPAEVSPAMLSWSPLLIREESA